MNKYVEELENVVTELEDVYERIILSLEREGIQPPALARTKDGGYVVLEALITLVKARTVLAELSKDEVEPYPPTDSLGMPLPGPELAKFKIYVDPDLGIVQGLPEDVAREMGWLLADGRALSRFEYPKLYELFKDTGFQFGHDEDSDTFNIPNFLNRVVNKEQ